MSITRRGFFGYCVGSAAVLGLSRFDLFRLRTKRRLWPLECLAKGVYAEDGKHLRRVLQYLFYKLAAAFF